MFYLFSLHVFNSLVPRDITVFYRRHFCVRVTAKRLVSLWSQQPQLPQEDQRNTPRRFIRLQHARDMLCCNNSRQKTTILLDPEEIRLAEYIVVWFQ